MKAGRYLMLMILVLISVSVYGQRAKRVDVKGTVVEAGTSTAVEQATVRLLSVKDSTYINGVASEKNGSFTLKNIQAGNYLLHITYIGFEPLYQPLQITGNTNPVDIGKMELHDGSILLGEAVVVGKAPEVIVRNDTIEYNADSFKVSEGSALEDLLKKMPGVEVDDDGKITVNGKEIKKILVDGKEFFSDDPKVATKNLPSNMVEKVQVLDRLSEMARMTGFDDGDEETVINLTVKPGMKSGWFGNAFAGYGSEERYEGNFMVNRFMNNDQITLMGGLNNTNNMGFSDLGSTMFSGMGGGGRGGFGGGGGGITSSGNLGLNFSKEFNPKLKLGGNARYSHSDNLSVNRYDTENYRGETVFDMGDSRRNNINNNIGADFRLEWNPDDKTQLIFRPNIRYSKTDQSNNSNSVGLDANRDTINTNMTRYDSEGEGYNLDARLEFSRKLNDDGRVFSVSLSGGLNDTYYDASNLNETYYAHKEDDLRDEKIRNDNTGFNYRAYVSWVEPIGNNNFIQGTYSINQQKQESLKNVYTKDFDTGEYTVIDTAQTKNFRNNFINQRISLSFKSVREKFNYTIGFNVDPSYSRSENFIGETTLSDLDRSVVNFSPVAQFRYNFSRQKNLRIDYNGRTRQPSMSQLQDVADYSDTRNVIYGNPDLKPRYVNDLSIRMQSFSQESQFAYMVMANGSYTMNDIISYVTNLNDGSGNKTTTYKNMNGNYNGNLRFMFNTPLKNRKFSINSMSMVSYNNANTMFGDLQEDGVTVVESKNTNRNTMMMERGGIDYRSDLFDLGINGNIRYTRSRNTIQEQSNQDIYNYGLGGRTTIYLPLEFKIESDINWSTNSGYSNGYEQNTVLWNASASKSFLKGNAATLRIKVYDILKERSNISYSANANASTFNEYNTLSSYFMVHFIYKFSIFKGGASMNDVSAPGRGRGPGGGRPGGPPRF